MLMIIKTSHLRRRYYSVQYANTSVLSISFNSNAGGRYMLHRVETPPISQFRVVTEISLYKNSITIGTWLDPRTCRISSRTWQSLSKRSDKRICEITSSIRQLHDNHQENKSENQQPNRHKPTIMNFRLVAYYGDASSAELSFFQLRVRSSEYSITNPVHILFYLCNLGNIEEFTPKICINLCIDGTL